MKITCQENPSTSSGRLSTRFPSFRRNDVCPCVPASSLDLYCPSFLSGRLSLHAESVLWRCVADPTVPPASLPSYCRFGDSSFLYKATLALSGFLEEVRTTVVCLHRCTSLRCQLTLSLQVPLHASNNLCRLCRMSASSPARQSDGCCRGPPRPSLPWQTKQRQNKKWRARKGRGRHEIGRRIKCFDM